MVIEPSTDAMTDAIVTFGRDLLMREDPSLGAKEIPFATLLRTVNAWFASQEPTLRQILCTETCQVRPEIVSGVNLIGIVEAAIRTHYKDQIPVSSATACLVNYGLAKFCVGG
jgi:hypothetical protein